MKYFSTNNKTNSVSFETAVMRGLAKDGGLYMPEIIPKFEKEFFNSIGKLSFKEIALRITEKFIEGEINENDLTDIISSAINFPAPLIKLNNNISILELFHGPTLAFKDFGARLMAKVMGHFVKNRQTELNILVATSGDTGSAVAYGFYDTPGINVYILYPKGKVSFIQEMQLTTLDKNITALEIDGTFDDCQHLVKSAFIDKELNSKINLSSANSINVARLIPQTFYYFEAFKQIENKNFETIFSVPSGNLGNLTAGLIAKKMGLPVSKFIGAANRNKVFPHYIKTGEFKLQPSIQTLSNAMDVGNPSNLVRIKEIYSDSITDIQQDVYSESFDDGATRIGIKEMYSKYSYVIDPHGSVGYLALKSFTEKFGINNLNGIILETAHPAKFKDVIEEELKTEIEIPDRLTVCLTKQKKSIQLSNKYDDFREFIRQY